MMAVYNQHLLKSGTPLLRFKKTRWQHTPMADTPRSNASSTYDLEDSFLAQGRPRLVLKAWQSLHLLCPKHVCAPALCIAAASTT